ncbi:sulfurtransferase complex subunit TusB [Marinobacter nauticus]
MTRNQAQTSTLHILNKAPEHPRFEACLGALSPGDILVLSENAVLALPARQPGLPEGTLAVAADLAARSLEDGFAGQAIGYAELVRLTEQHSRIISW